MKSPNSHSTHTLAKIFIYTRFTLWKYKVYGHHPVDPLRSHEFELVTHPYNQDSWHERISLLKAQHFAIGGDAISTPQTRLL